MNQHLEINPLSSEDLLTLQVLERELIDPAITKAYERELRKRIKYLNATPLERAELHYGVDSILLPESAFITGI